MRRLNLYYTLREAQKCEQACIECLMIPQVHRTCNHERIQLMGVKKDIFVTSLLDELFPFVQFLYY